MSAPTSCRYRQFLFMHRAPRRKLAQYFVVPKLARRVFPSSATRSTPRMHRAAASSSAKVTYAEPVTSAAPGLGGAAWIFSTSPNFWNTPVSRNGASSQRRGVSPTTYTRSRRITRTSNSLLRSAALRRGRAGMSFKDDVSRLAFARDELSFFSESAPERARRARSAAPGAPARRASPLACSLAPKLGLVSPTCSLPASRRLSAARSSSDGASNRMERSSYSARHAGHRPTLSAALACSMSWCQHHAHSWYPHAHGLNRRSVASRAVQHSGHSSSSASGGGGGRRAAS